MKTFGVTMGYAYSTMFYIVRTTTAENAKLFALENYGLEYEPPIIVVEELDVTAEGIIFEMYTGE